MEQVRKSNHRNVDGQYFSSYFTSTRSFNKTYIRNFHNFYGAIKIFPLQYRPPRFVQWILKIEFITLPSQSFS